MKDVCVRVFFLFDSEGVLELEAMKAGRLPKCWSCVGDKYMSHNNDDNRNSNRWQIEQTRLKPDKYE